MQNLESQEMIQTIRNSANLDPLTKVYNRRFLYEKAEELFANKASRKDVIVSMIDADNFKSVNDTYGHKTGDMLLQEFAALLKDYFPDDLIVRYGGEEFTVVSVGRLKCIYLRFQRLWMQCALLFLPITSSISRAVSAYVPRNTSAWSRS